MSVRGRVEARIARQPGHPAGLAGCLLARGLNRGNRHALEGAVEALSSEPGAVTADVGFGGGLGLRCCSIDPVLRRCMELRCPR